jgi:NAD-dependent DNA ligase
MKKILLALAVSAPLLGGSVHADPVRDWHDLDAVHKKVVESIHDMERARRANHYDMDGHGIKAEDLLRQAERELHAAVESARKSP